MIEFKNVTKILNGNAVLNDMSFDVKKGEVFVIVGPSGVGKSVTLKHMVRLMTRDKGEVRVVDDTVSQAACTDLENIRK